MRLSVFALIAAAGLAAPALAFDPSAPSDAERSALRDEIRAYLLDHPEVLLEAMDVLEQRQAEAQAETDITLVAVNAEALFNDPSSWAGGNPEGDIRLVEFVDYRCGYCKRAHPEVTELVDSDGQIKLIRKELPILGESSVLGARFALAVRSVAGDDSYRDVSDTLMTLRGDLNDASLRRLAESFELDWDAIAAEMNSPATSKVLAENRALAQRLGISGTPGFVVESQLLRGYLPLDGMRAQVARARAAL